MDVDRAVKVYIKIRDKRTELKRQFEEQDEVLKDQLGKIEAALLEVCKTTGTTSLATAEGTAIRKTETRYWTSDWERMYQFIEENKAMHLLERRIAQTSMKEFLESNPDKLPEGLNVDSRYTITVRRK